MTPTRGVVRYAAMVDSHDVLDSGGMGKGSTVGKRIAHYRKRAGLSQQELAVAIGAAVTSVSRWERDASQPTLEALRAMARVLDVDVGVLVARDE